MKIGRVELLACILFVFVAYVLKRKLSDDDGDETLHVPGQKQQTVKCKKMSGLIMETYDRSLCYSSYKKFRVPLQRNCRCPQKPIVTTFQHAQLGNQFMEYILVWAVAERTGREPYIPSCMYNLLSRLFKNIRIPPLSYISHCSVDRYPTHLKSLRELSFVSGSIAIPDYALEFDYVGLPIMLEVISSMQVKDILLENSQRLLNKVSSKKGDTTFVGVHVRRKDFAKYLKAYHNIELLGSDFFLRNMMYFRKKYGNVVFLVLSDDPDWCEKELRGDDVIIVRGNSAEQDLAIMASCNHSLIDYGSFGLLGAVLCGGEVLVYNLTEGLANMPNFVPVQ